MRYCLSTCHSGSITLFIAIDAVPSPLLGIPTCKRRNRFWYNHWRQGQIKLRNSRLVAIAAGAAAASSKGCRTDGVVVGAPLGVG